jgi:hypothetical protein
MMIFYHTAADVPKAAPFLVAAAEPKPADGGGGSAAVAEAAAGNASASAAAAAEKSAGFAAKEAKKKGSVTTSCSPASTPPLPSPPPPPPPPSPRAEQVVLRAEDGHDECTVRFSNSTDRNTCLADHDFPPELEESEVVNDDAEDSDCEWRDRDSADRHGHPELIKLGAAGAGKSGKIGVCATTRFTTRFTTSFTNRFTGSFTISF